MKKTYLDSSVLIAAARGLEPHATKAFAILNDPDREFVASIFLKLELLPKSIFHKQETEKKLYQLYFSQISQWAPTTDEMIEKTIKLAGLYNLSSIDAIHAASAIALKADEFITGEKPGKPLFRIKNLKVIGMEQ
ncbi:MAG: type II toxin-antitoxin system VapC family toxin [Candidatus Ozemobacteraceae bacterium]